MKGIPLASLLLFASATAIGQANPSAQAARSISDWTGVWQMTSPGKPSGSITLADDGGSLAGVIAFNVMNRETGQRIAIETRTMVNPHLNGNALVFQVRRILKPHLQGESAASEDASDPTDIVEMTMTATSDGKATLTCAKCGEASPTEVVKAE